MTPGGPDADEADAGRPMGLQRERTLLAWNRTLLTVLVVTALVVRVLGPPWVRWLHAPALALAVVAVWLSLAADFRYRRPWGPGQIGSNANLLVLWLSAVALGVGGAVAIVFG